MALMGETGNHHRSPLGSSGKGGMGRSGSFRILSENTGPHSPPVPLFLFYSVIFIRLYKSSYKRVSAKLLLDHGAKIDAATAGGHAALDLTVGIGAWPS